ncbi:MAG: hypothetical protein AAF616_05630 [Bacteroidota bacterium]
MVKRTDEYTRALTERQEQLRSELAANEADLKQRAKKIGIFALTGGVVAFLAYLVYRGFSSKKKGQRKGRSAKKSGKQRSSQLKTWFIAQITPYLISFLRDFLRIDDDGEEEGKGAQKEIGKKV